MLSPTDIIRIEREAQVRYIQDLHDKLDSPATWFRFELYAAITQDIEIANMILHEIEAKMS